MNLHRAGELDAYFPPRLQWAAHLLDRLVTALRLPGPVFVVRLEK